MVDRLRKILTNVVPKPTSKKVVFKDVVKKEPTVYERAMLCAFDFNKTNSDEISFRRGDILLIEAPVRLPSGCLTTSSADNCTDRWLSARDWRNGNVGLVPADFLTDESGESVVFDAFQCSSRAEAEEQLLLPVVQSGTFIVRPAKEVGNLTLSVLVREESNAHVEHYHLHYDAASQGYYISSDKKLGSLDELIKFYCDPETCTLTVPLCAPCPKLGYSAQKFSSCVVSRASVALKHRLSSGNFGEVWLATYRGVEVAVKRALAATSRQDIVKEAEVMHQLYHPRLVLFLGVCCEPSSEPVMIITEFMPNGALDGYLRQKRPLYGELLDMIFQISDGMAYLERRRAVHNDLRAANILVDADNSVKVADFGLTKILYNDSRDICDGMFPVRWTPPEATEVGVFQSTKSDVWSFGVLMYEVFTYGGVPYDDIPDDNEVIVAVENGHRLCNPSELGYQCEDRIYAKMQACWDSDPEARPTFEELYDFFKPSDAALP